MYVSIIYFISRLNQKENDDTENVEGNKNKKREKKIKVYHSFEPIKGQVFGSCKYM